jgi:hypothetical protein
VTTQLSRAVLNIWNDIDEDIEVDYERWYQRDHLRDRVGTPGFRSCRRYLRVSGEGRMYFTFSDLEDISVIQGAAYRERLANATEWTRRIMPHFRRLVRMASDVTVERGDGTGGFVATAAFDGSASQCTAARDAVATVLDRVMDDARLTRVRVLLANEAANTLPNPEAALRPDAPRTAALAILVEGSFQESVTRALQAIVEQRAIMALSSVVPPSTYRLLFSSSN